MYFLLYMSSASQKFSAAELGALLDRARKNDAARGVTGMLLHADGSFIQYIEGERDTVLGLFDTISGDRRHRKIQMLAMG